MVDAKQSFFFSSKSVKKSVKRCVRVIRASLTPFSASLTAHVLDLLTDSFEVYINMHTEKTHIKVRCIKYSETNNKINALYPI